MQRPAPRRSTELCHARCVVTTVPTWDQYMAPSLQVLTDGEIRRTREIVDAAADLLTVTDEQRQIVIPSGQQQYVNRGNWALS